MSRSGTGPVGLTERDWLLARAATASPDASRTSWQAWRAIGDIDSVPDHAFAFLVAVGARADDVVPDDEAGRLRGLHRRNWFVTQRLAAVAPAAVVALERHGMRCLLFGPLTRLIDTTGTPGWRHTSGIDLLVQCADAREATRSLRGAGFSVVTQPTRRATSVGIVVDASGNTVRVHARLPHVGALGEPSDAVWNRCVTHRLGDHDVDVLSTVDALVLAAAPRLGWQGDDDVWPLDVHHLVGSHGDEAWWESATTAARETPWGRAIAASLTECATQIATPVPDAVIDELRRVATQPFALRIERTGRRVRNGLRRGAERPLPPADA